MLNPQTSWGQANILKLSVLATRSASRCFSFITLNLNTQFIILIATIFVRISLPLVTVLNQYILIILFALYEIKLFILLIKGGGKIGKDRMQCNLRARHGTEYFGQWEMSSWPSGEWKNANEYPPLLYFWVPVLRKICYHQELQFLHLSKTSK